VSGPTIVRAGNGGHFGNALLTRRRVLDVRHLDLTIYKREPRGAIDVDLDVDGAMVRFIVTHLGLLPGERRAQVRRLLDALGNPRHDRSRLVVLCGDINEWFVVGRPLRWLHGRLGRAPALATFPAGFPIFALDRIWVRPSATVRALAVHATANARLASDHLPLAAEIELGPA
jgi:endonuclease/exonuclease/phosphatase family metal-dependent hydrolase